MMEGDRPKNVLDRLKAKADRDARPKLGPTVGGERIDVDVPRGPAQLTPRPSLVLDWEKRCRELELMIEEHSRLIVDLKEELHQQDERIKKLESHRGEGLFI